MFFGSDLILEDIKLIYEQIFTIFFVTVPLRCNHVALTLISVAKYNKEIIIH